ncbi:MAG: ABC transporter substrate-binding protein [Clostridia bacterium]|nr:ABC transporter substrate-binding protein [Clostridia bacterium]
MKKFFSILICISMLVTATVSLWSCGDKEKEGPVAYILCEKENAYSLGLAEDFKIAFEENGGSVVMESYPAGTTSFSEFFSKSIDVGAEVIFLPGSASSAPDLLKNAKELGIEVPILAGDTWESPIVLEAVKDTGLEVYCTTFFDESDKTEGAQEFVEGFKKFLHDNSEYFVMNGESDMIAAVSALGFDAYNVAVAAIRTAIDEKGADFTSVDVTNALWKTDFNGICGNVVFDKHGDAIKNSVHIKKAAADGSGFEFIKVQTVDNDAKQGKNPGYSDKGIGIDKENKVITVGVFQPTTGDNAAGGKQELLGIIYANSLDNKVVIDGEEYEIELCVSDNGSLVEYALATANKLVEEESVVVIGSYGSGVSIAAAKVFEEAAIPAIGASCTNEDVTMINDYYFRTTIVDAVQADAMATYAFGLISDSEEKD